MQGQRRGRVRLRSHLRSLFRPVTAAVGLQTALRPSLAHAADAEVAASSVPAGFGAVSSTLAAALPSTTADAAPPSSPAVDLSAAASAVADAAAALAGAIAQPSNFASRVARNEAVLEPVRLAEITACRDRVMIIHCRRLREDPELIPDCTPWVV